MILPRHKFFLLLSVFFICALPIVSSAQTTFNFNFKSLDPTFGDDWIVDVRCNRPSESNFGCGGWGNNESSPFLQEYFQIDGELYYHMLIGLPEDGFAQETFIKIGSRTYYGINSSASRGDDTCGGGMGGGIISRCNAGDPLGFSNNNTFTGNASGNPNKVAMYQVLGGTWNAATETWECKDTDEYCQEFIKDTLNLKPKLTQKINDSAESMKSYFEVNMSNSTYSDNTKTASTVNTLFITDPDMPLSLEQAGDFDYTTFTAQTDSNSKLTAGQYTYTEDTSTTNYGGAQNINANPYDYVEGDFNLDQDWTLYFDSSQNNY